MLSRSVLVSNGKGGTGKTSLTAHVGALAAEAGYNVLLVDLDPQGNLGRDLGYFQTDRDDEGRGLLQAIQFREPLNPVKNVRERLDVIPGGPFVDDAAKISGNIAARGRDPRLVLDEALAPFADQYNLILIDSPPGDRYLQEIALSCAEYVLIPTRSDEASLDGLSRVGVAFSKAREVNPGLQLMGVILFGIGASATAIQREVREKVEKGLGGAAPVFEGQVRYLEAPAVEARNRGMLVHEYERDLVAQAPAWHTVFKGRKKGDQPPSGQRVAGTGTAFKLAGDYAAITTQVLQAMADHDARAAASSAGSVA